MNVSLRFPIPEKRPMVLPKPRVPHKALKAVSLSIRAASMRSPIALGHLPLTERLKIAQRLLLLQQRQLLRVWVDGETVRVGHFDVGSAGVTPRRAITWGEAVEIVDNPEKHLARYLRGLA